MFLNRRNKISSKQACTRCSILRFYFSAILLLVVLYIVMGDKLSYLSFVNKETGVYLVFGFGGLIFLYRIFEWYFILKDSKNHDQGVQN